MYKALENSGNIIILEKISNDNKYEILDTLENIGFKHQIVLNFLMMFTFSQQKKCTIGTMVYKKLNCKII